MDWFHFEQILNEHCYAPQDKDFIKKAFLFGEQAHLNQKRASGEPYFQHVLATAIGVAKLKLDAHTVAAALLHDTCEDCNVTHEILEREFGSEVARLVEGVTNVSKIRYRGVQRKVESLRKMFLAIAEDVRVVLIKLMDRMHNIQTISHLPPEKQKRIALETLELYAPLAYRLGIDEVRGRLEDLAFPIIYPVEYAWVKKEMEERTPEGERYLEQLKPAIEQALARDNVAPIAVDFRRKFYYSLWQKLMRNEMDFGRITDLLAMRIIVSTIEECYRALGIIHALWKPLPGRIKDYIALPKPNGYRSLHTTVFCEGGKVIEFQIRTAEMHEEAEHGIAAHWAYEEAGKPKKGARADNKKLAWIRQLSDWQKEIGSEAEEEEFLESLKIDFFKDRIFVLTPKGEVLDFPEGSTPVDFAYHIHSDIGNRMIGAKVNGKMVSFSHQLTSGDTVEILTQKNRKPNAEWLNFVKTSFAKNHIRSTLHKEEVILAALDTRKPEKYEMRLTVRDRVGLLKDISAAFSAFRINIQNINTVTQNKAYPIVVASFETRNRRQLEKLLTRVKAIKDVEEISVKSA